MEPYPETTNKMIFSASGCAISIHIIVSIWLVLRKWIALSSVKVCMASRREISSSSSALNAWMNWFIDGIRAEKAEVRKIVATRRQARREHCVASMLPVVANVAGVLVCGVFHSHTSLEQPWLLPAQECLLIFYFLVVVIWNSARPLSQGRGIWYLYFLLTIITLAWVVCSIGKPDSFIFCCAVTAVPRVMSCVAFMAEWPSVFSNMVHSLVSSFIYVQLEVGAAKAVPTDAFVLFEVVFACVLIACSVVLNRLCLSEIEREMDAVGTASMKAVTVLLDITCDAAIELDEDLRIVDDSPKLAATLLHGADRSCKGTEFPYFIERGDKDIFTRQAMGRARTMEHFQTAVDVLQLAMRDGLNHSLPMEVFLFSCSGFRDRAGYVVGVRELLDASPEDGPQPPKVRIDVKHLMVEWRSPNFELADRRGSCEPGRCLKDWLVSCKENNKFLSNLRLIATSVETAKETTSFQSTVVLEDLKPPGTTHSYGHTYSTTCDVDVSIGGNERTGPHVVATLTLVNIKRRRSRQAYTLKSPSENAPGGPRDSSQRGAAKRIPLGGPRSHSKPMQLPSRPDPARRNQEGDGDRSPEDTSPGRKPTDSEAKDLGLSLAVQRIANLLETTAL
eukprot:TRINITY_DN46032_c0_g1_i1.p1 TRINITY_DN46032_c0_g1~~TRINITY_DN46032_c0_g1_i1.p1  ORF type:complete len:619 (-),score=78.51 TRINITY_DN46032_c0_g1_i1:43-1899(-)